MCSDLFLKDIPYGSIHLQQVTTKSSHFGGHLQGVDRMWVNKLFY